MDNKLPSDENLLLRGCYFPYMCSVCRNCTETSNHLFFECEFSLQLWHWLSSILNTSMQFTSLVEIWLVLDRHWSPQCKLVVKACVINIINTIWFSRNKNRFQDKIVHWRTTINLIIANVSLSGNNNQKASYINMDEFRILKACQVTVRPPKAPIIREVISSPPITSLIKINTDGAAVKNPSKASAGGILRNGEGICFGCFAQFLGEGNVFFAELNAAMLAIEVAAARGFWNVWLERDSQLVLQAFNSNTVIP